MRAMLLHSICQLDSCQQPLVAENLPQPVPGKGEVLLQVLCCGVCHTELDIIEGRTPAKKLPLIPGHEVVARVVAHGEDDIIEEHGTHPGFGGPDHRLDVAERAPMSAKGSRN